MNRSNSKLSLCVLISCMNQDKNIVERTHVQTNVVVVNQCDVEDFEEWDFTNVDGKICHVKFISTKERGLSRSRNMAIRNAIGDVCLVCDDDEELADRYEAIICDSYDAYPNADIISFAFDRRDKSYSCSPAKHNIKTLLRTSSVEITFKLKTILDNDIIFDVEMGSGSGNGAGEENMFLMSCKRRGLKMYYVPGVIGRLLSADSQWFKGYTQTYFVNWGWSMRRILGPLMSIVYLFYWIPTHRYLYKKEITTLQVIKNFYKGWKDER